MYVTFIYELKYNLKNIPTTGIKLSDSKSQIIIWIVLLIPMRTDRYIALKMCYKNKAMGLLANLEIEFQLYLVERLWTSFLICEIGVILSQFSMLFEQTCKLLVT